MYARYFAIFIGIVHLSAAQAQTVCTLPKSTAEVLSCLETYHPDMRKTLTDDELIEGIRRSASQFPNPELSIETLKGENLGDTVGEDTIAVAQKFEIGGKRSARLERGRAEAESIRVGSTINRAQVRIDAHLNLIRFRQLIEEIAVLEEALATYEKVHRQFAARPRLTPDQQVTFGLFKLSMGDYRHKLAALQAEKRKAEYYFRVVPELNFSEAVRHLPKRLQKWPKFETLKAELKDSPRMKAAEANLKQADASYDLAKANSFPDVTVSLATRRTVEGAAEYQSYGIGVALPLPLWNINGGERRQAIALKSRAEIEYRETATRLGLERLDLIKSYQSFVDALERSPVAKEIDTKHRNTEALFYRGVISGVLVIEAHRQILEFTQTQNELELETMQALLNLHFLDGRLAEFKYE